MPMNKSELLSSLSPARRALRLAIGFWRLAPHEILFGLSFLSAHFALAFAMPLLGWEIQSAAKAFLSAPLFLAIGSLGLRLCIQESLPPALSSCIAIPIASSACLALFLAWSAPLDAHKISRTAFAAEAIMAAQIASLNSNELSAPPNANGSSTREAAQEVMDYSRDRARHALGEAREANAEKFAEAYAACVLLQTLLFALAISGIPSLAEAKAHAAGLGLAIKHALGSAKHALADKAISDETEWSRIESQTLNKASKRSKKSTKTKSL